MPTVIYNMGLRFKATARANAARAALKFPDAAITYAQLDAMSDNAASHLLRAGVERGDVVAVHAEKSALTYAAMIACLKIGAPYVALDTASPHERLDRILQRCQPKLILTDRDFAWQDAAVWPLEQLAAPTDPLDEASERVTGNTPAYLMFTSGSTGFPKGAVITHASMLNFCDWSRDTFAITPQDVLTGVNALYFDNSVFDFTASLFNGACLVPVEREAVTQPKQLAERVNGCTIWFSVPSLLIYLTTLKALTPASWPHMRAVIFGGEGYAKAELKKLHAMYGPQATLWNVYGPTECTCICSAYAIGEKDFTQMDKLAPLGHLASLFTGAVMDEAGARELPDDETGELFLMGPQVASGYYNDPDRTQAAFGMHEGKPCYRTGDLVWKDARTGYYHFAGRKDNQVKHMGYRIELEEIEAALNGMQGVAQAAVIYHRHTPHGGRIVGFVSAEGLAADAIKTRLRARLPSYMIPEEIQLRSVLPKNANGKVDRKALALEYTQQGAPHV